MKQVVYCGSCSKLIRKAGSFTAMLTRTKTIGDIKLPEKEKVKIILCRQCAQDAGYKVK